MTTKIDKIAWILIQDGQILSVRSKGNDTYYLPGGKREDGETDLETLLREIEEELSVRIIPESVKHYGRFEAAAHGKSADTQVIMTCYTGSYEGRLAPAAEIEEMAWLTYPDRHLVSAASTMIFDQLHEMNLLP